MAEVTLAHIQNLSHQLTRQLKAINILTSQTMAEQRRACEILRELSEAHETWMKEKREG